MDQVRQPEVVDHLANLTFHGAVTKKNESGAGTMLTNSCKARTSTSTAYSGSQLRVEMKTSFYCSRDRLRSVSEDAGGGETLEIDCPRKRDNAVVRNRPSAGERLRGLRGNHRIPLKNCRAHSE